MRYSTIFSLVVLSAALSGLILIPLASSQSLVTDTIGDTTGQYGYVACAFAFSITASQSGSLQTIGVNFPSSGGRVAVAIYSDNSNRPGSLLASSAIATATKGWNDVAVTSITIVAGTKYWLAFQTTASQVYGSTSTQDTEAYYGQAFSTTFPGGSFYTSPVGGHIANLRMTYGTGTTSTTTSSTSSSATTSSSTITSASPSTNTFNVQAGATQVIVIVQWTGSGSATIQIAGPNGTPILSESSAVVYDQTTYTSNSTTPTNIHRVTFTLSPSPTSAQTWTALVTVPASYTITIKVS